MSWALFRAQSFALDKGSLQEFDSDTAVRGFCGGCGSPIFWQSHKLPDWIDIAITSLDNPDKIQPGSESWLHSKVTWVEPDAGRKHYDKGVGT